MPEVLCSDVPTESGDLLVYHLYIWEGAFIIIFNALLMIFILIEEKLRTQKEFVLYAGCLVFEVIFGASYSVAGVTRLITHYTNDYLPLYTAHECLSQPHVILLVYITPCVGFLVFITSIDRFISVFLPTKYIRFSHKYVYALFVMVAVLPMPLLAIAFATTSMLPNVPFKSKTVCGLIAATTTEVYLTLRIIRIVFTVLGALLYVPIMFKIRKFSSTSSVRILRTTITVLLMNVSTILLYTIPDISLLICPTFLTKVFFVANLNKGVVNVFIFLFTQRTIRDAVIQTLRRNHRKKLSMISLKSGTDRSAATQTR